MSYDPGWPLPERLDDADPQLPPDDEHDAFCDHTDDLVAHDAPETRSTP